MPISTNPNARAKFWLDSDSELPLRERPVYLVRFMTGAEHEVHADVIRRAYETPNDRECFELLEQSLFGITGWENFEGEYSARNAMRMLSDRERWELARYYTSAVRLTDIDRFFSDSPPSGAGAASAGLAAPTSA